MDVQTALVTLLAVAIVSALAPFVVAMSGRLRLPQVVVLIVGGVVIGPQVLGWADPASVTLIADVGLGFLFLMAGYELELGLFRQHVGRRAVVGWFVTAGIAVAVTGVLAAVGFVHAFVPVALGLTTTAFGALLPILRDNDMLGGRFASFVMPAGAVGEFLPIVGIAIFLSANGKFLGLASLVAMFLVALLFTVLPRLTFLARFSSTVRQGENATSQTTLRLTVALLFVLLVVASEFGLDVVLGAFLAGVVLKRWAPGDVQSLETKLDAVGYGFFIPVFFVASGMDLDLASIAEAPLRLVVFFLLLLVVRGLPSMFLYRKDLDRSQRWQMTFLTATALPLLVALAAVGLRTGHMLPENAAALVGAGVLSMMIFPGVAVALHRRGRAEPDLDHGGVDLRGPA
ncbi:cation:proton antiporter [Krasilnikoviella flava]|uniref:Transporter, CPA2 family (TC 2.A.37) n=1 Tax=Krasilnikoviella flava TaxID=526729 RepID=A0A1T5L8A2_9MICO|nr:cation:proton antiporter [Krasilnikoviella flava]SKC72242.1 transporter, CPA2 family (TC 2.A.37) [Krasilnikoviella flava]